MSVLPSNHPRSTAAAWPRRASAALALAAFFNGQSAFADEAWQEQALEFVNQAREAEGLAPLALEDALVDAAEAHAEDMLERDYCADAGGTSERSTTMARTGSATPGTG
jgi:uncharacterized protein YkwD